MRNHKPGEKAHSSVAEFERKPCGRDRSQTPGNAPGIVGIVGFAARRARASRKGLGGPCAYPAGTWAEGRTPSPAPARGSATPRAASAPHYLGHLSPPPPNREGLVSAQYPNLFCIYFFSGAK